MNRGVNNDGIFPNIVFGFSAPSFSLTQGSTFGVPTAGTGMSKKIEYQAFARSLASNHLRASSRSEKYMVFSPMTW